MNSDEFRIKGKELIDYIADYLENIRERRVFPDKKPGFIRGLIPDSAPVNGESWESIFKDVEKVVMPGVTHWQSPHMHAYFPALNSYPSMLGEMLSNAINCLGFTWASSPVCTELEMVVMNWLGKMIGLPEEFLHRKGGDGGGVIQTTAKIKEKNENFGSSLLLSNVPMSPKIVNASFAALYDQGDVLEQFTKTIKLRKDAQDSPAMRRRIKGILMSGKQFSLDSRLDLFHGIETSPTQKSGTNNLPVVEDSGEPDEKGSSSSENENTSGSHTPHQQDTLEVASPIRHNRSKSVDHQMNLTINDLKVEKEVCNRCGHKVEKVEKLESV